MEEDRDIYEDISENEPSPSYRARPLPLVGHQGEKQTFQANQRRRLPSRVENLASRQFLPPPQEGSPPPLSPRLNKRKADTLRRRKNQYKEYGRRAEKLYDDTYATSSLHCGANNRREIEDTFVDVSTLKLVERNYGPLIRNRKVRKNDYFDQWSLSDLVQNVNKDHPVAGSTVQFDRVDLDCYIKFETVQKLQTANDLSALFQLMRMNDYSSKYLAVQSIQNILFNKDICRLSEKECEDVFVIGLKILFEELKTLRNNFRSLLLVEALILQVLACIFICMLNSATKENIRRSFAALTQEIPDMNLSATSETLLPEILLQVICTAVEDFHGDCAGQSFLCMGEWDTAIRDGITRKNIVDKFPSSSLIEQITWIYLLANMTIRHKNFDNTLKLIDESIQTLKTVVIIKDIKPTLFFVNWITTNMLLFHRSGDDMHLQREKEERDLLMVLNTIGDICRFDIAEFLLFHENTDIRNWYLHAFISDRHGRIDDGNLIRCCNLHIEWLLIRCNLKIEMNQEESTELQRQPKWKEMKCRLFGHFGKMIVLYPSIKCLQGQIFSDYKEDADPLETRFYINELDMLTKVEEYGGHENIVELAVHQSIPYPLFYILYDHNGENLQTFLLRRRSQQKPIHLKMLLEIILQAVKAIDFLHGIGIVHRGITASAFTQYFDKNNRLMVSLTDLKLAKLLWKEGEPPRRKIVDLQCDNIPTRWTAPESLTKGIFSRMSDSWMVFLFAVEVMEHGRWPWTDNDNAATETTLINMLFNEVRVQEQICTPRQIHSMILDGTELEPSDRMSLLDFESHLVEFISKVQDASATEIYQSAEVTWKIESSLPTLSKKQLEHNSICEKGVPTKIRVFRKTHKDPEDIYNADREIRRAEKSFSCRVVDEFDISCFDDPTSYYENSGDIVFEEIVLEPFVTHVWPKLDYLRNEELLISPWLPQPVKTEHTSDEEFILRYKIPYSSSFLEACINQEYGNSLDGYLEFIYKLALLVDSFHEEGWLLNCLRAKNIRISSDRKVFIPRIGRFIHNHSTEFYRDHVNHIIPTDMRRWLPIEAIENGIISIYSDVYSFAMFVSEICSILEENGHQYEEDVYQCVGNADEIRKEREINCAPFGDVHSDQLARHLKEGHIPRKQISCPDWLYGIMLKCWEVARLDRPTMRDIIEELKSHVPDSKSFSKPNLKRKLHAEVAPVNSHPLETNNNRSRVPEQRLKKQESLYSYSTSRSASISDPKQDNNKESAQFSQTALKRSSISFHSASSTTSAGRMRPKKKTHTSIFGKF